MFQEGVFVKKSACITANIPNVRKIQCLLYAKTYGILLCPECLKVSILHIKDISFMNI